MRLLITRPRADAEELAARLAEADIESLIEPVIDIRFDTDTVLDLEGVQATLLTSRNGVRALTAATPRRDIATFAVGDATARALGAAEFAEVESADGDVESLAALVIDRLDPSAGPLLHVAGSDIAGDLAGALEAAGFEVRRRVLYKAAAATELSAGTRQALADGDLDGVLLFSPRSAAIFVGLMNAAGLSDACGALDALCLSPAVASAAGDLPWRDVVVAERPTLQSLLQSVRQAAYAESEHENPEMSSESEQRDEARVPAPWQGEPDADEAPAAEEAAAEAPPVPKWRRWRWVAGGIVLVFLAGAVGWGILLPRLLPGLPPGIAGPLTGGLGDRLVRLEQRLAELESQAAAGPAGLAERVAALESRETVPGAEMAELDDRIRANSAAFAELSERLETVAAGPVTEDRLVSLEQRITALGTALAAAAEQGGGVDTAALAVLARRVDRLEDRLAAAPTGPAASPARLDEMALLLARLEQNLTEATDGLSEQAGRLAALESVAVAGAEEATRQAGLVLAIGQLNQAARGSTPFAEALEAARAMGAAGPALALLESHAWTGVPDISVLRARFPPVAAAVVRAARLPEDEGWIARTLDRLASIVTVRRVGEVEGEDAEALVARAEQRLEAGNLATAVAELDKLTGGPAAAAIEWLAAARARLDVDGALAELRAEAIGRLGSAAE